MMTPEEILFIFTALIAVPSFILALWQLKVMVHNLFHPVHRRMSVWVIVRHLSQIIYQDLTTDIEEMKI